MSTPAETTQSNALTKIGSASPEQQQLPDLWDEDGEPHPAWSTPASEEEYQKASAYMITAVEPEASDKRVRTITRLLKSRDYTRAELLLAMKRLPFDADASHNYGRGFNPADVERIIDENRELRQKLSRPLSSEERDELITEHSDKIDPDAFHCCGFNKYDEPRWRYAPDPETKRPDVDPEPKEPNPDLGESLPGRSREDADVDGPTSFEGLVSEAQEKTGDE